jgi:hypothetical protein
MTLIKWILKRMKVEIFVTPDRGKVIRLLEPLTITIKDTQVIVPEGFESDGMSTPRWAWSLVSPALDNRTLRAAVAHDWLYENHICTRKEADDWFYDAMVEDGFPKFRAYLAWMGVRIGGGSHYKIK